MESGFRTVRLDKGLEHDLDPTIIGARSGKLWSRDGLVVAGIGEAGRIGIERPGGAADAQAELAALVGDDELNCPGSGAVAFAALPFDRTTPGELIVPEVVIVDDGSGRRWMITAAGVTDGVDRARAALVSARETPEPTTFTLESAVTPEFWRDSVVGATRDRIAAGDFRKVVLARELRVRTDHPIRVDAVLRRLAQSFGNAIVFAVDGFVGATPEMLVARRHDITFAHPLAGTAPRSSDPAVDARLSADLLASTKNQTEHRITIDWLLDNLLPFCSYVDAEPEPSIVSLANVHHLGTRVEGRLSTPAASVLELAAALHPTPAVGGDPQQGALGEIERVEPGDRGRYAGPVGWVDGAGNGEFGVGIRSASIDGSEASVWAGVGVIGESDPQAELDETRSKFQAMLSAMVRP